MYLHSLAWLPLYTAHMLGILMNSVASIVILDFSGVSSHTLQKMSSSSTDPLEMIEVCLKCYDQLRYSTGVSERLRREHCCNPVQHQWSNNSQQYNSVCTTVINAAGR